MNPDESSSLAAPSRAYRMFKEGSDPIDVAVALNLRQREVSEYYKEYWVSLHILNQIYEETGNDIWSILELFKRTKAAGLNATHVDRLLSITNNDIPLVEYRIKDLLDSNVWGNVTFNDLKQDAEKALDVLVQQPGSISFNMGFSTGKVTELGIKAC